jgi:hypothetical protein
VTDHGPTLEDLRRLAAAQRIHPTDDDLEGVLSFLRVLLPALEEVERSLPPDTVPAGMSAPT